MNVVALAKRFVADDRYGSRLFDVVADEVRSVLGALRDAGFSVTAPWSEDEFRRRIVAFDERFGDLCRVEALMSRWGGPNISGTLTLPVKRVCDQLEQKGGTTGWLGIQWYPALKLTYAAGVTAVASGRYGVLKELLGAPVLTDQGHSPLVVAVTSGLNGGTKSFQLLPGLERRYTPCSDHLHGVLQPLLDEMLFMGSDYEWAFDRFEVLYAIEHAYVSDRGWGPIGRFGWKDRHDRHPLGQVIAEATAGGDNWPPLVAGLCGGSHERFNALALALSEQVRQRAMW